MAAERNKAHSSDAPDFSPEVMRELRSQSYSGAPVIEGVQIVDLQRFVDDGGYLLELARMDAGRLIPQGVGIRQITVCEVQPDAIKAWHVHGHQSDAWFVPPGDRLLVGLWDVRSGSASEGATQRFVLGDGRAQLLHIPKGVAHGVSNPYGKPALMIYLLSEHFSRERTDELRLPWDAKGAQFWGLSRG